jgi:hypothetical protein
LSEAGRDEADQPAVDDGGREALSHVLGAGNESEDPPLSGEEGTKLSSEADSAPLDF